MNENDQPEDLIRYDVLTQEALRDVIRKVLEEVSAVGLPGEHHFFITFRTDHPGVRLSSRMRQRYPEEMTIVIQHSFWDLKVTDKDFEIDLSFDDILERLRIPFEALKGFFDPHVKFGVQFDAEYLEVANVDSNEKTEKGSNLPQVAQTRDVIKAEEKPVSENEEEAEVSEDTVEEDADKSDTGAEIVSLDKFRKKQ